MLLSIDEVVNTTTDATIVVFGQNANVFDLPAHAQADGNFAAFYGERGIGSPFFLNNGPWLIAPATTGDTEPASVKVATQTFGGFTAKSLAYWPVDLGTNPQPVIPAYKQGIVLTTGVQELHFPGVAAWVFVVTPHGNMTVQMIQLLTYQSVGASGQVKVGPNSFLDGVNQGFGPQFANQQPPDFSHALYTATWQVSAGNLAWSTASRMVTQPGTPMPYFSPDMAPSSWGQAVTQTTLLSAASTPFDIDWQDADGQAQIMGMSPSSPILHLSLLAGGSLTFKRPWLQDYAANLISYPPSAADAWDDILAMSLLLLKILIDADGELPWPLSGIADYVFDEAMQHIDPGYDPPVPAWLQ